MDSRESASKHHPQPQAGDVRDWIDRVHQLPEVRREKVDAIRTAIRENRYEPETAIDETVSRLFDEHEMLSQQEE